MALREAWMKIAGPGLLGGATMGDYFTRLRENRFAVAPSCWLRAASILNQSFFNSAAACVERWRVRRRAAMTTAAPIAAPLFILGHWRSGTTHLHHLLALDPRLAFPTTYQCCFPHSFLTTEAAHSWLVHLFMPRRRPMDNVEWSLASPQEDEFALLIGTGLSPYLAWIFPRRADQFDRFLTMRDVSAAELARWRQMLVSFLGKVSWKNGGRPLVLKSPTHTARVRLLVDLFPDARFVHIHRDPLAVFASTRSMLRANIPWHRLQAAPHGNDAHDERILRQYVQMHDAYFADRRLIPPGRLVELPLAELEAEPLAALARVYQALDLPPFADVEPTVAAYVGAVAGYQKNVHRPLPEPLRERIVAAWRRCFDEWGYPAAPQPSAAAT
jgi:hypothetical protein